MSDEELRKTLLELIECAKQGDIEAMDLIIELYGDSADTEKIDLS